jgi:hypothetical protein
MFHRRRLIDFGRPLGISALTLIAHGGTACFVDVLGQFDASFGFGYENGPPRGFNYIVFH